MIKSGINNDDSTVNIQMGITMKYGGADVNTIYVNGNSWVGFGSSTQHLNINGKDGSYNVLYYANEVMYGQSVFRIRVEGNIKYNAWNANNLVWELICFQDGAMALIVEKNDGEGTLAFDSKGNGTLNYECKTGKSYGLVPSDPSNKGTNYSISEGSYKPIIKKYLIQDGTEIKRYVEAEAQYSKVGDVPVTAKMFKEFGNDSPNPSRVGIVSPEPKLLMWCDYANIYDTDPPPKVYQSGVLLPKVIKMVKDETFGEAYILGITKANVKATCSGDSKLKFILSANGGEVWKAWGNNAWITVDINNMEDIKVKGMNKEVLEAITEAQWSSLGLSNKKIRFAWYMEQPNTNSKVSVSQIKLDYKTQGV